MSKIELLKMLYGEPTMSKCCKANIKVVLGYGDNGFVCKKCLKVCETILRNEDNKQPQDKNN